MSRQQNRELIKQQEGLRLTVYYDSEGIPTVGFGHALLPGSPITRLVADILFNLDYEIAEGDYARFSRAYSITLDPVREGVLTNMFFNMGYRRVCSFKKMIKALQKEDYQTAALEMLDSKWAVQVKGRARRLADRMRRPLGKRKVIFKEKPFKLAKIMEMGKEM